MSASVIRPRLPCVTSPLIALSFLVTLLPGVSSSAWGESVGKQQNLRTWRTPAPNWSIAAGPFSVAVQTTETSRSAVEVSWQLTADLDIHDSDWVLYMVRSDTQGVRVMQTSPDALSPRLGKRRITLEVTAPTLCTVDQRQEEVLVTVMYGVGRTTQMQKLALDHRCLLGANVPNPDATAYAHFASRYLNDPTITRLVEDSAHVPVGSVEREIERLKQMLDFGPDSVQKDPFGLFADISAGEGDHYVLTPTQTARLGGDCEDWSILIAAYLTRRGISASMVRGYGHIWVEALDPSSDKPVPVDLVGTPSRTILSQAPLPLRR